MINDYTPTPAPPVQEPDEQILYYGARLVGYVITFETCGQFTDEQLDCCGHAITWLLGRQPRKDEDISPCYFTGLRAAEHLIYSARAFRALDTQALTAQAAEPQAPGKDGGTREPARPFPPRMPSPGSVATPSTRNPQPAIDF